MIRNNFNIIWLFIKRIIKIIISTIFVLFYKSYSKLFYKNKSVFVILYYHGITELVIKKFAKQMDSLKQNSNLISLVEIKNTVSSKINVAITFDDALLSVLLKAQPELARRNIPFTVFVPTGYLGKLPNWDIDSEEKAVNEPVMTIEQLKMLDKDLCTLGSHTVNHKNLTRIPISAARIEMLRSKEMLETILNKKITHFSFPYGAYNLELVKLAKEIGYTHIYTINTSFASIGKDEFLFDRISVSPEDWAIELFLKIHGGYNWNGFLQKRRYLNK